MGAAWIAFSESTAAMIPAGQATPFLAKKPRSFSTERAMRILAASSLIPSAWPTSRIGFRWKNRSRTARRSFSPSWFMASSSSGDNCSHAVSVSVA